MVDQDPFLVPQVFNIIFFFLFLSPSSPPPASGSTWTKKKKVVADAPSPWGGGARVPPQASPFPTRGCLVRLHAWRALHPRASGPNANTIFWLLCGSQPLQKAMYFKFSIPEELHIDEDAFHQPCKKQTPKQNPGATAPLSWSENRKSQNSGPS